MRGVAKIIISFACTAHSKPTTMSTNKSSTNPFIDSVSAALINMAQPAFVRDEEYQKVQLKSDQTKQQKAAAKLKSNQQSGSWQQNSTWQQSWMCANVPQRNRWEKKTTQSHWDKKASNSGVINHWSTR